MRKKGFTLIELLVVIAIIAMLLAILMPALNKVKKIAMRVVCATNLKGLGSAMAVYANDYDDRYPVAGGGGTSHAWGAVSPGWQTTATSPWPSNQAITVAASLYLLVREADVSPKSFVCGSGGQKEFDGKNDNNRDIVELFDFGGTATVGNTRPSQFVSYSYHMPYAPNGTASPRAADGSRSAAFAALADKNPWYDSTLKFSGGTFTSSTWTGLFQRMGAYYSAAANLQAGSIEVKIANAKAHDREGQNVTFADGHAAYEKTSDVGVKHDNIYTLVGGSADTLECPIRRGVGNAAVYGVKATFTPEVLSSEDTMLVNDDTAQP